MLTLEKAKEMVTTAAERSDDPVEVESRSTEIITEPEGLSPSLETLRVGDRPRGEDISDPEGDLHPLSEVVRYLKVSENRIRHWEKSFSQVLTNHRNQYNHRMFSDTDVKILERIKFLQDSRLYTKEGIVARLNSKFKEKSAANVADRQFQQKLLIALNTLATEIKGLRREVREDLKGDLKKELDHLTLLLFPPKQEKKWWQIFK